MILIYIILALLVASVAWIFAMIAQLAGGLPQVAEAFAARQGGLHVVEDYELGRPAPNWPSWTQPLPNYVIVVLSTSCGTCMRIAAQLADDGHLPESVRLVIVGPDANAAAEFAREHRLGAFEPLIDDGGKWTKDELGISQSPALFVVRNGTVADAFSFGRAADIDDALNILEKEKGYSHA